MYLRNKHLFFRALLLINLLLISFFCCFAQSSLVDIEGDTKVRGSLDIHHADDFTSIMIGLNAGNSYNFNSERGNTFVGSHSGGLLSPMLKSTGSNCTFYGYRSGFGNRGNNNTLLGMTAGYSNSTGRDNCFIGKAAGFQNIGGSRNIYIGVNAGQVDLIGDRDNAIAIGHAARVGCSNCAVIGGVGEDAVKLGLGNEFPPRFLTLHGSEVNDVPDMAISSNDALIELGPNQEGPHGIKFGDTDENGMKLLYRTGPNELTIETGKDISTNTAIVVFEQSGEVGIGTSSPNDALDVVGDIDATGCIQTDDSATIGGTCLSDRRLKKNINALDNQLQTLVNLNPVTYNWKRDTTNRAPELGLIAQEVEEVIPEMVITEDDGTKKIRYDISLSIRMIKALQEQQKIIDDQNKKFQALENQFQLLQLQINDLNSE